MTSVARTRPRTEEAAHLRVANDELRLALRLVTAHVDVALRHAAEQDQVEADFILGDRDAELCDVLWALEVTDGGQ